MSDEKYIEAEANENGANVAEDGTLDIEDLFDSEKNYDIAEAVSAAFGADEIRLDSDLKCNTFKNFIFSPLIHLLFFPFQNYLNKESTSSTTSLISLLDVLMHKS